MESISFNPSEPRGAPGLDWVGPPRALRDGPFHRAPHRGGLPAAHRASALQPEQAALQVPGARAL